MERKKLKTPIRIAPLYIIALNKTPQHMLAVPAAKTNHYGIAVSSGGNTDKDRLPIKFSPVKSLSETEVRMYTAYGASLVFIAELKHLANSPITLKAIYWKLLSAPQPTNIKLLIDRNVIPYGDDAAMTFVEKLLKPAGISMKYVPDREKIITTERDLNKCLKKYMYRTLAASILEIIEILIISLYKWLIRRVLNSIQGINGIT